MLNPYVLLAIGVAWVASIAGAGYWSYGAGKDRCEAQAARDERTAQIASAAAAASAAEAISRIEVKNTTIRQTLEKEVRENVIYRDCRSGDDARRLLNSTAGVGPSAEPTGDSQVRPAASAPE